MCLAMMSVAGEPLRVHVSGPASDALADFQQQLTSVSSSIVLTDTASDADLIMAAGDEAFLAAPGDRPVLGLQVSPVHVQKRRSNGCRCSGIFHGARPADQLALLETLLPRARRVGVIVAQGNDSVVTALRDAAGGRLDVRVSAVASAAELPAALAALLPGVDVLLLLPDPGLFNAETARLLLLTSYRQGRPVIGPDSAFVRAGSLASVDISTEDLVGEVVRMLPSYSQGAIPAPRYAGSTVSVNPHVARAYGVTTVDAGVLEEMLRGVQ